MNIRYETIRRVIITYPKGIEGEIEGGKAVEWCYQNGYHIKEIGYTRGMKKRKLIAEKVIRKERESGKLKTYIFVSNDMYGGGIIVVKAESKKEAEEILKREEDIYPIYIGTLDKFIQMIKSLGNKQFWGYWEGSGFWEYWKENTDWWISKKLEDEKK